VLMPLSDSVSYRCHDRTVNAYLRRIRPEGLLTTTRLGCFFQALIKYADYSQISSILSECSVSFALQGRNPWDYDGARQIVQAFKSIYGDLEPNLSAIAKSRPL